MCCGLGFLVLRQVLEVRGSGAKWFRSDSVSNMCIYISQIHIYSLCKKTWMQQWIPLLSITARIPLSVPPASPPKDKDRWLQGGSSVWHPKIPSVSTKLAVAYVQALTGWDGVSSRICGNMGCFLPSRVVT